MKLNKMFLFCGLFSGNYILSADDPVQTFANIAVSAASEALGIKVFDSGMGIVSTAYDYFSGNRSRRIRSDENMDQENKRIQDASLLHMQDSLDLRLGIADRSDERVVDIFNNVRGMAVAFAQIDIDKFHATKERELWLHNDSEKRIQDRHDAEMAFREKQLSETIEKHKDMMEYKKQERQLNSKKENQEEKQ